MKRAWHAVLLTLGMVAGIVSAGPDADARGGATLAGIAETYFADYLDLNPLEGTQITGLAKYEGKVEIAISPAYLASQKSLMQRVQRQLEALDVAALPPADKLTYDLLREKMRDGLEGMSFPDHLMPVDQYGGLPVFLAQLGSGQQIQPLKTVANYRNYLQRLEVLPDWVELAIGNMREGIRRGVVPPKALVSSGLPALKALTEGNFEKSPFYAAIEVMPAGFAADDRAALTKAYREVTDRKLQPAMARLFAFVETEYLPKCRDSAGIDALPDGANWYAYLVRHYTTTNMTPAQIHTLGLQEVARIRGEMEKIRAHYKFDGTLAEFLTWAETDQQFRPFKTEKEVLDAFAALNSKIMAKLPDLFGRAPKAPLEIRPEPELTRATASDHYSGPALDGSRPGVYYAVIEDPTKYSTFLMTTVFLHEGQPGHHYHTAIQQELPLPKFRQHGWFTAYGEGWALYAETLGREMGLFNEPHAYLGHLSDELLRAVRLVTDTGLHSRGWTREQTIKYMMDTQGYSEHESRRYTERYMGSPGQALAYKIGSLKIQELRERAKAKLGAKFSLKAYHDLVLADGALPLTALEQKVNAWIAAEGRK